MGDNSNYNNPTSPMFGMMPGADASLRDVSPSASSKHYWRRDRLCRSNSISSAAAQSASSASQPGLPRQAAVACVSLFGMLNLLTWQELICGDANLVTDVKDDSGWCSKNTANNNSVVDYDDDSSVISMKVSPSNSCKAS